MDEEKFMSLLLELFRDTPRQGPGSKASTRKALGLLPRFDAGHRILDIGCGSGAQTEVLWQETGGHITAVDIFPEFVERVTAEARRQGVLDRVSATCGDMADLPFEPESFDLVWSEGSIFIVGFEAGLTAWRPLLAEGGYIGVSEACWIKDEVPEACRRFWGREYPDIGTIDEKIAVMENCGFELTDHFTLPPSDWRDEYYAPLRDELAAFRERHESDSDPDVSAFVANIELELEMFDTYGDCYSYGFFLAKRLE
jgi:SAM-dependent methyltransferase